MTWTSPSAVELVILCLAAYRLFRFTAIDDLAPMNALREWVTGYRYPHDDDAEKTRERPEWLADLAGCPFCLGFWISLALVLGWWAWPIAALAFALPWAVSAAVALVTVHLDPS